MVIWFVGLSGAGKSTIAKAVYTKLKHKRPQTVLIDGDEIRAIFKHDTTPQAYTPEGRYQNACRIQAMCQWLDKQQIDVVCSILCVFPEFSPKNRLLFSEYHEVFVDVALQTLTERDNKGLYKACLQGDMCNVVGVDIPYLPPEQPDLVLQNDFNEQNLDMYTAQVLNLLGKDANEL